MPAAKTYSRSALLFKTAIQFFVLFWICGVYLCKKCIMLLLSMPGGSEWILIILAVLILFGGKKIPEFMRGLGKGIREFNDAKTNVQREIEEGMNEKDTKRAEKAS